MFLVNSRLSRFTAPAKRFPRKEVHAQRGPFSRSYGANLPSSLTEGLPSTLVCSTSPPVSVCGTVSAILARGFSWLYRLNPIGLGRNPPLSITPRSTCERICLSALPTGLEAILPATYPSASPHRS